MSKFPFNQKKRGQLIIREFSSSVNSKELVWHRDRTDREITVKSGKGWQLQLENKLPVILEMGKTYYIPRNTYHRVMKGLRTLVVEIREPMKITKNQLRKIIKEAMEQGPQFPDLSHPTISQFADKTSGPTESSRATWFTSMQSYRYKAGGSSDQTITVYHLPDGQYMARIGGSYSNTLSNDRRAGKHADAISAIEAALDSSPSSTGPTARELLKKVGEKVQSRGYIGQD